MLTGRKAFEGTSQASLIAAILSADPPPIVGAAAAQRRRHSIASSGSVWRRTPTSAGRAHERSDERAAVDRGKRIADRRGRYRVSTRRLDRGEDPTVRVDRGCRVSCDDAWPGWALYLRRAPVDERVYRSTFVPPGNENPSLFLYDKLALSPDGRRLAFVANDANGRIVLWVRELAALAAQPLADTEGAAGPFWSPDSRFIAFSAGGKLKKIDASGGPAISLCDTNTGFPGSWGQSDVILFTPTVGQGLSRVSAAGGTPTLATTLDTRSGELWHGHPFFLPDGRHFLYAARLANPRPAFTSDCSIRRTAHGCSTRLPTHSTRRDSWSSHARGR